MITPNPSNWALSSRTRTLSPVYPVALAVVVLHGLGATDLHAQGCMATRVSPPMFGLSDSAHYMEKGQRDFSFAVRHYEASRHFYDHNKENVPANAPRVTRTTYDASATWMITDRNSVTASLPFQTGKFDRSPIPPHTGSVDEASGIGDLAVTFRRWLFDPATHPHHNLRLGIGIKLPTGDYDDQTNRYVNVAAPGSPPSFDWRRGPADVAIQPGDGGFGVSFGIEGFRQLTPKSLAFGEVTYLANPRGENGVNNQWSGAGPYVPNTTTSVPDYFLARAGVAVAEPFGWSRFSVQLGLRIEGQPPRDLFGSSEGFRRPGYSLSVEPGIAYAFRGWNLFVSVPTTIYRVRWRSVDEKRAGRANAVSAAFADHNILAGFSRRW